MKKSLASLAIAALTFVCTVNYPTDCTIVTTGIKANNQNAVATVECTYEDGSRTTYFGRAHYALTGKLSKTDFVPSPSAVDQITVTCQ